MLDVHSRRTQRSGETQEIRNTNRGVMSRVHATVGHPVADTEHYTKPTIRVTRFRERAVSAEAGQGLDGTLWNEQGLYQGL